MNGTKWGGKVMLKRVKIINLVGADVIGWRILTEPSSVPSEKKYFVVRYVRVSFAFSSKYVTEAEHTLRATNIESALKEFKKWKKKNKMNISAYKTISMSSPAYKKMCWDNNFLPPTLFGIKNERVFFLKSDL